MITFSLIEIGLFSIFLSNWFLGFFVYFKERKNILNQIFLGITLTTGFWLGGLLIVLKLGSSFSLFGGRLAFAGASLIPLFFLLFSFEFPKPQKKSLLFSFFLFFLSLIGISFFFISLFSPLIVTSRVKKVVPYGITAKFGKLYPLFGLYFLIFISWGIFNLFKKIRIIKTEIEKRQIEFFLIGAGLSLILGSLPNLILPLFFNILGYSQLGPFAIIFFIVFTALAITRYHLLGIEVILTEILVGLIGLLLIIQIFSAPTVLWKVINGSIFVLFCIFGYLLIRATYREIKRREELERISKAKSEFISITSHQLRTPLSAIKGYLSMIAEGIYGEIPERLKKPLKNVYLSNERLIKLVNDLLDISRIEAGKMEMKFERTNLEELINEVISELEVEAKKKGLYLKFEKPKEKLPQILIDKEKIRQIILNIIDNAIKYTKEGGATIKLKRVGNFLQIAVSDTGIGMTKEEIAKLFESFSRGAGGRKSWVEGAGLGLYISKKLIDLHQGKIWAESEGRGKGSTFYIELPIK